MVHGFVLGSVYDCVLGSVNGHPSEIQRLLEKKMYIVFLAKYQLFNISIAKIH